MEISFNKMEWVLLTQVFIQVVINLVHLEVAL